MKRAPKKPLVATNKYLRDPERRAFLTRRSVADSCLAEGIEVEKPARPIRRKATKTLSS
jgi:hypothetical protein